LCRILEAVIDAGATTLNIPDTVGYSIPADFGAMIASLRQRIPNADKAVFSVHCHNDLGLAVALIRRPDEYRIHAQRHSRLRWLYSAVLESQ
jgi:isopropylmalate/homocitrate/citramalate synthase